MRRLALFALAVLVLVAPACGSNNNNPSQQPIVFTAALTAANEVPPLSNPSESGASGTVTITFNVPRDASGNITGDGTWNVQALVNGVTSNSIILGHIHTGAAGVSGSPIVNTGLTAANAIALSNGSGTVNFTNLAISQTNAQTIANNPAGFYFNLHSSANPGGVVRGQLVRQ
jgi:2',3'-cyclic-nucleotide 2'-phosphodiesterase / 3'-nucleotidase / 5'-nucleotidase